MMAPGLLIGELADEEVQGQDQIPPSTPRQPHNIHIPPVGHFMAPHRCPHCEIVLANVFSLPPFRKLP